MGDLLDFQARGIRFRALGLGRIAAAGRHQSLVETQLRRLLQTGFGAAHGPDLAR